MSRSSRVSRRMFLLVSLLVIISVLYFGLTAPVNVKPITKVLESTTPVQPVIVAGVPVRLKIPKIGVDAVVEPLGLTIGGDMMAPSGGKTVGWYKHGTYPGNIGSAVIDGHFGTWNNGDTSVFDDLNKLVAGDSVVVEDEKGVLVTFIVRELRMFGENEDATVVFRSSDGKAHLNLITCQGDWIESEQTRTNRLVVFADRQVE